MPYDPLSVADVLLRAGVLLVLPGAAYVRWLFPDRTLLEAAGAGYGLAVAALVASLAAANLGLGLALTGPRVLAVYAALLLPLAWPLLRGFPPRPGEGPPIVDRPRLTARRAGLGALGLAVVAVAVLWAGHSNIVRSYLYPHHVDGYIHWGNARAMIDHGGLPYDSWLTGQGTQGPTDEVGFWYLLAAIAWLTGLPLSTVAIHGKLLLVAALALAAWAYGSRDPTPFGLEAALLVPLIPTTHRFLGPMFLVPMTLVLTLALGAGILARSNRRVSTLPALLLLGAGGLLLHSATAGVVALLAGWRLLLAARSRRELAWTAVAAVLFSAGFLALVTQVPYLHGYWERMLDAWMTTQEVTRWGLSGGGAAYYTRHLTRWTTALFGLGVVAAFRARRPDAQALVLSLPPLLTIMIAYERWTRGFASLYDRTFFHVGFLLLMLAAVGLAEARRALQDAARWSGTRLRPHLVSRAAGRLRRRGPTSLPGRAALAQAIAPATAATLLTAGGLAATAAGAGGIYTQVHPIKKDTFYNTHPENETYELFLGIRENLDDLRGAELALLDPVTGNEFAAITGLHIWAHSSHPYLRVDETPNILDFLDDGCQPLDYLNRTGAEMVVGADCQNPHGHYDKVQDQVYLYEPALRDAS